MSDEDTPPLIHEKPHVADTILLWAKRITPTQAECYYATDEQPLRCSWEQYKRNARTTTVDQGNRPPPRIRRSALRRGGQPEPLFDVQETPV